MSLARSYLQRQQLYDNSPAHAPQSKPEAAVRVEAQGDTSRRVQLTLDLHRAQTLLEAECDICRKGNVS